MMGSSAIPIDLQAVFNRCYDAGPYFREVRYQHDEPVPPLAPERREWLRSILQAAGVV